MERALNPELLGLALGQHEVLPSPEELSLLLADAELALLLRSPNVTEQLTAIGWYLHGVASSKYAFTTYGVERQRAAFQVSGHIFDLLLQTPEIPYIEKLKYCFAAQIAYARSSLDPNALALYRREFSEGLPIRQLIPDFQEVALSCGVAFLGFDQRYIYQLTSDIRNEVDTLVTSWEVDNIASTLYGAAAYVAASTRDLMSFLVYGRIDLLDRARERLREAILADASVEDDLSRWIAAHLLNFSDNLEQSSIWTILPPDVPMNVRQAFVKGHPPILTLWPPQIDFLGAQSELNPLSEDVKRLLLSTPTSGGKTLTAQLLITSHLATNKTSVCYVAPTRSLCREVRQSLQSRLRFVEQQIVDSLPEGNWLKLILPDFQPEVEVMTPERLSYLIRTNSKDVLDRFGMFIFDEVHLVGDKGRGWTLEEDLSYLHYATENLHHKIILISAVIGNRNHFVQWISGSEDNQPPLAFHRDWRGPRRIHAIWTSEAFWDASSIEQNNRARKYLFQKSTPLYGRLDVRISHTGEVHTLRTEEPVGNLVMKGETEETISEKDSGKSTPFYKMLISIIEYLAGSGPVLIIESTKPRTIKLAEAIADGQEPINLPQILNLTDLVVARLGEEHPLKRILEKGVAYHHGSLPSEIRNALEEAVSEGHLKYIVATTTLTEGVNLPVTSVVIASQGSYGPEGYTEYITGAKLVNAIGRAGRATKETEGIVVLARQAPPNPEDFDKLNPNENDLHINSMLASEEALEELAAFEELYRISEDAIFEANEGEVADFLKFVWFIASELENLNQSLTLNHIHEVLGRTLGWVQLDDVERSRWLQTANIALNQYQDTQASIRKRWASSGTSISSASRLEQILQDILAALDIAEIPQEIISAAQFIVANNRLQQILELPEAPKRKVFTRRGSNRLEIDIPVADMLIHWLQGMSLIELSDTYLADVDDVDYRFEQLGDYLYSYFEVYFPWVFSTIISWVNDILIENGSTSILPTTLPANIRYGVGNATALELMVRGIQSRSLALKMVNSWPTEEQKKDILSWIRSLTLSEWATIFDASPNEIRNLLEVARVQRGGVAVDLLINGSSKLAVDSEIEECKKTKVSLRRIEESELSMVGIWIGDQLVGKILCKDQSDILNLLNMGLSFTIEFSASSGKGSLSLKLIDPE